MMFATDLNLLKASGLAAVRRLADGAKSVRAKIIECAAGEQGRLFLWSPVAAGAGAALYLGLRVEPSLLLGPSLAVLGLVAACLSARLKAVAIAIALIAFGFAAAQLRAASLAGPQLARELSPREIVGRLISVDEAPKLRRLIIEIHSVKGLDARETPRRARISWRGEGFDVLPGDRITLRAGLSPPPPPSVPGGFDFARQLYFQRIGALGFAVTAPRRTEEQERNLSARAVGAIERARMGLTRRILEAAPGDGGAIVAATITGKRLAISEGAEAALRDSGLAHLIAISGLNMALATGIAFFVVRLGFAAVPAIALRFPVKKWAAVSALFVGLGYLLISGGDWSAKRAFIMTSIFFVAIIFDRQALTLRNVAIAALAILLLAPEAVIHPGFQMSFAAVTALIAAYEWHSKRSDPERDFSPLARVMRYFLGLAATDVIASTATAPFAIYHFNRMALFGLPANVISLPIVGFIVMPAAMFALVMIPFGLDGPFWKLTASGYDVILAIGRWTSSHPGAVATTPQWPIFALVALTLGGLWVCLQSRIWRLAGLAAIPAAAVAILAAKSPDIFVTAEGENVAMVVRDGGQPALALFEPRKDGFEAQVWKEHVGLDRETAPTIAISKIGRCDAMGCVATIEGATLAVSNDPLSLGEDCARADAVIALFPAQQSVQRRCKAILIDRRGAWDGGARAILIEKGGSLRIRTVNEERGRRPWTAPACRLNSDRRYRPCSNDQN